MSNIIQEKMGKENSIENTWKMQKKKLI